MSPSPRHGGHAPASPSVSRALHGPDRVRASPTPDARQLPPTETTCPFEPKRRTPDEADGFQARHGPPQATIEQSLPVDHMWNDRDRAATHEGHLAAGARPPHMSPALPLHAIPSTKTMAVRVL